MTEEDARNEDDDDDDNMDVVNDNDNRPAN